jgi:hypothetical protein
MMVAMQRMRLGVDFAGIADAAAPIVRRIAIDALAITPGPGDADPIILAYDRRKIANNHCELLGIAAAANIRKDALGRVGGVDP